MVSDRHLPQALAILRVGENRHMGCRGRQLPVVWLEMLIQECLLPRISFPFLSPA